ncbi:MAG: Omp28-related outer membrane protein [Flavobacteriales bacterium]|nr:Omp28-related outer membrane protein [Flavobacteriales bacterium]
MTNRIACILALLSVALLSSCDVVQPPYYGCIDPLAENFNPDATHDDGSCVFDPSLFKGCMDTVATNYDPAAVVGDCHCIYVGVRKLLLEEYTGHTCGNCPRAAAELKSLICQWGDRVVPIAVHAGFFALPQPGSSMYAPDFRTPEGNAFNELFGNSAQGLPNGLVDRKSIGGGYPQGHTSWAAQVSAILALPPDALIDIQNTYSEASRTVNASIDISVVSALGDGPYLVIVSLTEDSIIGWQKDYELNDPVNGENIEGYAHMHMLRRNFNGTWGEQVGGGGSLAAGQVVNVSYSLQLDGLWNDRQCNVVAYLYRESDKQVIQAEIRPVRE